MKIVQKVSDETKEQVVLLYCKGLTKTEIISRTGVTWWHLNTIIYNLEAKVYIRSELSENLEKIRKTEDYLIKLAEQIATGAEGKELEFNVLLSCFSSCDANNHCVFIP